MPEQPIQEIIDGLRARLQAELEVQLDVVARTHERTVERVRQAAAAEAEQRWVSQIEAARAEWTARLESEVTAARAETEQRLAAEAERARAEAEQRLAAEAEQKRAEAEQLEADKAAAVERERELEEALAAERERAEAQVLVEREQAQDLVATERQQAQAQIEAERRRADEQIDAERQQAQARILAERERADRELAATLAALEAERLRNEEAIARSAPAREQGSGARLLDAIGAIDRARSLSDVLALTAGAAAAEAPRAALFVANGPQLEEWSVPQVVALSRSAIATDSAGAGLLRDAMADGQVHRSAADGAGAPEFAALPPDRAAIACPLMLGDQPVAVLYADEGPGGDAPAGWREAVEILARHASACLAYLTAVRTAQAVRMIGVGDAPAAPHAAEDEQSARRYARLLVSEIKLYNEAAVRIGREKRDLLQRLKPEIDRARRLYAERIPPTVYGRDACFDQELVQTLADGDGALLG